MMNYETKLRYIRAATTLATSLLVSACQMTQLNSNKEQSIIEGKYDYFFKYNAPKITGEERDIIIPTPIVVEFNYIDGCLLAFNGTYWMTPVFPKNHAEFNPNTQILTILGKPYKMGKMIDAVGRTTKYLNNDIDGIRGNVPQQCITERIAIFYGDYGEFK